MKIGDLVRTTRNTQKHFGLGIIVEKRLYESDYSGLRGESLIVVYWLGLGARRGVYEGDHHFVLVSEKKC